MVIKNKKKLLFFSTILLLCIMLIVFSNKIFGSFGTYKHVFIIGVDGLGASFEKVDSPNFDRIFGNYAFRYDVKTEFVTMSAQNWGSILTGVHYKTHSMTNDSIKENEKSANSDNQSIFYYVRNTYPDAKLVSIVNWEPLNIGVVEDGLDVDKIDAKTDDEVLNYIDDYLEKNGAPTLMFVQFDEVDSAAHMYGGFSEEYYNEVEKADERLGKIFDKINSLGIMDDSLIIVVADHGETNTGHGGHTKEESSALLAVRGKTINKTLLNSSVQNRDVSAIALYALGVDEPDYFVSEVPEKLFNSFHLKLFDN